MVLYNCDVEGCDYATADVDGAAALVFLEAHLKRAHALANKPKAPAISPPKLTEGIMLDGWELFVREWETYKKTSSVPPELEAVYIINCCDDSLRANLHKEDPQIATKDITIVTAAIKRLAVVSIATCVLQIELLSLSQDHAEPIRQFQARAWGKARSCALAKKCDCGCNSMVDYSDHIVKIVLINGIADEEIKREVLGVDKLDDLSLNETVGLIETKECAARSLNANGATVGRQDATEAAVSGYKRILKSDRRLAIMAKCDTCGENFKKHAVRQGRNKDDELLTYKSCKECFVKAHKKRRSEGKDKEEQAKHSAFGFLCGAEVTSTGYKGKKGQAVEMPNIIFNGTDGWKQARPEDHPRVKVELTTAEADYAHLNLPWPKARAINTSGVTDAGQGVRKQVTYPSDLQEGDSLDILVTEVISPGKFWFHLRGEETSEALDKLMDDMEAFYENNGEDFRLENPRFQCKSGAIMAAPYRNLECYDHRVLISEVCPNNVNQVKVFYLDYGTVRKIPISSVRVLHEKFTELPAQALEAKLWDLADPSGGNKWSKESTRRFYELVKPTSEADWGCFSIVRRIETDASSGILHLELYDTLTNNFPRGLCINQQLVDEGFALNEERTNVEKNVTLKTLVVQEDTDRISGQNDLDNNPINKLNRSKKTKEHTAAENERSKTAKKIRYLISRVNLIENTETLVLIYKRKIWLSSGDIASLMPTWKGKDILAKMLEVRKVKIKSFHVAQENLEKFEQLLVLGMKSNEKNEFTFYPLNKVPVLVDMFNRDIEKAKKINEAVEEAITKVKLNFGIDD